MDLFTFAFFSDPGFPHFDFSPTALSPYNGLPLFPLFDLKSMLIVSLTM